MQFRVNVKFGSRIRVSMVDDGLVVTLTKSPKNGAANKQLISVLAKYFGVPGSHVSLVSGAKSRRKIVEILK